MLWDWTSSVTGHSGDVPEACTFEKYRKTTCKADDTSCHTILVIMEATICHDGTFGTAVCWGTDVITIDELHFHCRNAVSNGLCIRSTKSSQYGLKDTTDDFEISWFEVSFVAGITFTMRTAITQVATKTSQSDLYNIDSTSNGFFDHVFFVLCPELVKFEMIVEREFWRSSSF